jgi:hypothetical protein
MNVTALRQRDYAEFLSGETHGQSDAAGASHFDVLVDGQCLDNWDEIAAGFDDVNYDQTALFTNLRWGEAHMSGIMLRQGATVIAAARAVIITLPGFAKGIAFVRGGPMWRLQGRPADTGLYRKAVQAIKDEYSARRGHHLVIIPRFNPDYAGMEADMLKDAGFRVLRKSEDPNRYFVNLALTPEQHLQNVGRGWRRALKKAQKNEFDITLSDSVEDVADFIALNRKMLKRKGYYDSKGVLLLPQLIRDLPPSLRPKLLMVRYRGQLVTASANVFTGDTVHGIFGASDDTMLSLNAGYAHEWWLLDWLSHEGFKWYDHGGDSLSEGLRYFKTGIVGKEGRILPVNVEWEYSAGVGPRAVAELAFAARAAKRAYIKFLNR